MYAWDLVVVGWNKIIKVMWSIISQVIRDGTMVVMVSSGKCEAKQGVLGIGWNKCIVETRY